MKTTTIPIKGMHCRSCELLIKEELKHVDGVQKVEVNYTKGQATLYHHQQKLDFNQVFNCVSQAGYTVGHNEVQPWISKNFKDYEAFLQAAGIVALVYLIASLFGVSNLVSADSLTPSSLPLIFIIGLTAGLSTCMALVGGLVLSTSSLFAKAYPHATPLEKFRPHIAFNIGRVAGYFVLGGLIGWLGSVLQLSNSFLGILTAGIGLLMALFGLQLSGLFPRLATLSLTLPSTIAQSLGISSQKNKRYNDTSAALLGGLTFFLPCGFTQSMQLYAMSTGSFWQGAIVMGIFALGTMPGLLGIGSLTSFLKGSWAHSFYKLASLVILFFAFTNIRTGMMLSGLSLSLGTPSTQAQESNSGQTNDKVKESQSLKATFNNGTWLTPGALTAQVGVPTTLTVDVIKGGSGCTGTIMIPGLVNQYQPLQTGTQIQLAFTAEKPGSYPITCGMGMVTFGQLVVKG